MAGIDAKSDAIYELVEEGSEVEKLATGFTFTEGPIWHPTEHHLLFSDMPGDVRRKYTPDGTVVEVLRPARKCNGMTYDADLNLLVCEHVSSSLVRERPDGVRDRVHVPHRRRQGLRDGRPGGRLLDDERRLAERVDQLRAPKRLHGYELRCRDGGARLVVSFACHVTVEGQANG